MSYDGYPEREGEIAYGVSELIVRNWISTLPPELEIHGERLRDIAHRYVMALHASAELTQDFMSHLALRAMGAHISEGAAAQHEANLNAIRVFFGMDPRAGLTGVDAFDDLFQLEDNLLAHAPDDPNAELVLLDALGQTREIGLEMYQSTLPPAPPTLAA